MGRIALLISFIVASFVVSAKELLKPPTSGSRIVIDKADVMDSHQEAALHKKLDLHYLETSDEIVIVTETSLEGELIQPYSLKLAKEWGIGRKGNDNGVLLYAAIQDRKIFIQVGKGLEGAIPDVVAGRIIRNVIAPNFRDGNYAKGFDEATDILIGLAKGEFDYSPKPQKKGIPLWVIILIIIILLALFAGGGNDGITYDDRKTFRRNRPPIWIGGGGGGWSGGGGGFGGGGFGGGFGGGGFGGGGAGGSW